MQIYIKWNQVTSSHHSFNLVGNGENGENGIESEWFWF